MNADIFLHGVGILNDAKLMFKNFKSNNKNSYYINYISSVIGNIEHTFETVYSLFKIDQTKFFQNKENLILLIEIIKFFFKLNELKMLKKEGFEFYVEKSIYFSQVLKKNEEEEIDDLDKIDTKNIFLIKKKRSKQSYHINTNLIKIPEKITAKFLKNDANSTDDSIKLGPTTDTNRSNPTKNNNSEFFYKLKELLYLIRPVIYMASLILFKKNKFFSLLISLIIDYLYLDSNVNSRGNFSKQKIYYAEYIYRYRRLYMYLFREPIFSSITVPLIRKVLGFLRMPESIIRWAELILNYFTKYYYIL